MGCSLLNVPLFTLKFDYEIVNNFSVKSGTLRKEQPFSYTE